MERAFYKIQEVAEIIGLGKSMTYKLVSDGHIPSVRLAGTKARRVSREALQRWIAEQAAKETPALRAEQEPTITSQES